VASESDVIGWTAGEDALLLAEMEEVWEVRESTLGRPDLVPVRMLEGYLPAGSLLSEPLLELDGEGERVGDLSWERP
jgi:hypothetical protein